MVDSQTIREDIRYTGLERVEPGERVLTQRDQHVHAGPREQRQQLAEQRLLVVVEEVLLELVEDQECLIVRPRQARLGRPLGEHRDLRVWCELAQPRRNRRAEDRALADAARAVEHREPRREEIRDEYLGLALAPEEEERIELGVLERGQPLERGDASCGHGAHAGAGTPRYGPSAST